MATRTGLGATAAAATRACCSSTERTTPLSRRQGRRCVSAIDQPQSLHQPPAQLWPVVVALQRKVNRSLEVPAGISEVVSITAVHHHMHRVTLVDQQRDGVCQLDLAAGAARNPPER